MITLIVLLLLAAIVFAAIITLFQGKKMFAKDFFAVLLALISTIFIMF